jgi:hypothetical protein
MMLLAIKNIIAHQKWTKAFVKKVSYKKRTFIVEPPIVPWCPHILEGQTD